MKIDRGSLNLVMRLEADAGTVYAHSTPIGRATFEDHFEVLAQTFSAIYGLGLNVYSGPRVAALMLRRVATKMGVWDRGPDGGPGVSQTLMGEVRRLTNLVVPRPDGGGWMMVPYDGQAAKDLFTDDDLAEVENALVFFTCVSAMHQRATLVAVLSATVELWGMSITRSSATEFMSSLTTSTRDAAIAASPPASPGTQTAASSVPI